MYILFFILLFIPDLAFAGPLDILDANIKSAVGTVAADLQTIAITWLSAFVLVQMVITNLGLLKSGADIEAIIGKLIGSILWFAFCFYVVLNGVDFIGKVSDQIFGIAGGINGVSGFDAGLIIGKGTTLAANLIAKINQASGILDLFMPALLGGLLGIFIIITAAFIAFKVFLIKIETALIVMLAPLSFAFLGLNALKDQGIAPFKSLISLTYRIILLAVILKSMDVMSDNLVETIDAIDSSSIDGIWSNLFSAITGYVLLGFLAFKSDSIASSLASGSTNLGTADVAGAAAMGAAAGAAVGSAASSGGAAVAGGAKSAKSMADLVKNMAGGGSVSNASQRGVGGADTALNKPPTALASQNSSGSGGSGNSQPQYEQNASGAPIRPDPSSMQGGSAAAGSSSSSGGGDVSAAQNANPSAASHSAPTAVPSSSAAKQSSSGRNENDAPEKAPGKQDSSKGRNENDASAKAPGKQDSSKNPSPESGEFAEINGGNQETDIQRTLARMETQMNKQNAPRKPTFRENLGKANSQMAQEKGTTHVSINANASD